MESDCTVIGVNPPRFETLPSSFVASVVNAYNAATRMMIHITTLMTIDPTFSRFAFRALSRDSTNRYCSSTRTKRIEWE